MIRLSSVGGTRPEATKIEPIALTAACARPSILASASRSMASARRHSAWQIGATYTSFARLFPTPPLAIRCTDALAPTPQSASSITDGGGIQGEAPAPGIPALVLCEVTERPEGLASGNPQLAGTTPIVSSRRPSVCLRIQRTRSDSMARPSLRARRCDNEDPRYRRTTFFSPGHSDDRPLPFERA
jgi:hypothetical protein